MRKSYDLLAKICEVKPFIYAVAAIQFASYGQFDRTLMLRLVICTALFLVLPAGHKILLGDFVRGVQLLLRTQNSHCSRSCEKPLVRVDRGLAAINLTFGLENFMRELLCSHAISQSMQSFNTAKAASLGQSIADSDRQNH